MAHRLTSAILPRQSASLSGLPAPSRRRCRATRWLAASTTKAVSAPVAKARPIAPPWRRLRADPGAGSPRARGPPPEVRIGYIARLRRSARKAPTTTPPATMVPRAVGRHRHAVTSFDQFRNVARHDQQDVGRPFRLAAPPPSWRRSTPRSASTGASSAQDIAAPTRMPRCWRAQGIISEPTPRRSAAAWSRSRPKSRAAASPSRARSRTST